MDNDREHDVPPERPRRKVKREKAKPLSPVEIYYLQGHLDQSDEALAKTLKQPLKVVQKATAPLREAKPKEEEVVLPFSPPAPSPPEEAQAVPPGEKDLLKGTHFDHINRKKGVISYTGAQSSHDDGDGISPGAASKGGGLNSPRYRGCIHRIGEDPPRPA